MMLPTQRKISTVLATEISGYNRLIASPDENVTILLSGLRQKFSSLVASFDGNLISNSGRDLVAEFPSAVNALRAAVDLQSFADSPNANSKTKPGPRLQMGMHLGEIIVDDDGVVGDGLDAAVSLSSIAKSGEIIVSSAVREQLEGRVDSGFIYGGKQAIDKLLHPVNFYHVVDSTERRPIREILSELFRRRIFRSAGAYFVVAWLLVQAGDTILPVFNTPSWVLRSLIILLIVGFPLAMLMTWSVNLSADGLIKTTDSRFSRRTGQWLKVSVVGIAIVISATVLWSIRSTVFEPPTETRVIRSAIKSQPVIAVAELTKRVGDASLDWLGRGIANLLRDAMADSPLTIVYSLSALQTLNSETDSGQNLAQAAKEAGVDYLIVGDYMSTTSGIVISVHIEDLINDTIIPGDRIEVSTVEEAIAGSTQLVRRLKQSLNLPYVNQVGHLAADFAADNLQAYELYISGLEYLATYDYESASELLRSAIEEAPQFGIAKYRLAQILEATGRNTEAYRLLNTIDIDMLSEREKLYVAGDKQEFSENRDTARAIELFRELVAKFPFDSEAQQKLAEAYWLDYQNEASIKQLELLVELHPQEAVSWMALGERQIDVGDNDGARVSLAKYLSMQPEDPYAHALLGELASRERRFSEAKSHYRQALRIQPTMGLPSLGLARIAYFEEKYDEAMLLWRDIVGNDEVAADYRIDAAFDYAYILRAQGKPEEAYETLLLVETEIQDEGFREALAQTVLAEMLMDLGDLDGARQLLLKAANNTLAEQFPTRPNFYLARIALMENDRDSFDEILATLWALKIEPDTVNDYDRNAAANYLVGMSLLPDNPTLAASSIESALVTPGFYAYRIYELALAEAQAAAGDTAAAHRTLSKIGDLDASNPRLDMEYDRRLKQGARSRNSRFGWAYQGGH